MVRWRLLSGIRHFERRSPGNEECCQRKAAASASARCATPLPKAPVVLPSQSPNSLWIGLAAAVTGLGWWGYLAADPAAVGSGIGHDTERPAPGRHALCQPGRRPGNENLRAGLTQEVLSQIARFKELSVLGR
jgi:hypothetical protein